MNKKYKYHPIFIIKPIFTSLLILFLFSQNLLKKVFSSEGNWLENIIRLSEDKCVIIIPIIIYLVLVLLGIIKNLFAYKKSYLEINQNSVIFNKTTLFGKKHKESSITQISNIQFQSGIIDKIFSAINLQIDIDSSATASSSDYKFLLRKKDAEEFKAIFNQNRKVLAHPQTKDIINEGSKIAITSGNLDLDSVNADNISEYNESKTPVSIDYEDLVFDREYAYTSSECFNHIFYENGLYFITIGIGTLILSISDLLDKFSISSLIIFVIYTLYSFIKSTSKYYAYTVKSNDKHIYWKHGLFNTREFTIEKKNIKSVEINQSLFARIRGKYSVEIKVVGVGNSSDELKTIILYSYKDRAIEMLSEILPDRKIIFDFERESIKVAMINSIKFIALSSLLLCLKFTRTHIYLYFILIVFIFIASIIISKGTGINVEEDKISFLSAILGTTSSEIEFDKIEHISLKSNFIMKKLGLYKIELYYKDSIGTGSKESGYFKLAMFNALRR